MRIFFNRAIPRVLKQEASFFAEFFLLYPLLINYVLGQIAEDKHNAQEYIEHGEVVPMTTSGFFGRTHVPPRDTTRVDNTRHREKHP